MEHKLFRTPDYVRKEIDEIVNSEEIQKILKEARVAKEVDAIKLSNPDFLNLIQLPAWLEGQYRRYDKVLGSIESAFKKMGRILPPEPGDFMDWFFNKYALRGDLSKLKIQDFHFEEYHRERLKKIDPPTKWEELFIKLKSFNFIFSSKSIFNDVMEYKSLPVDSDKILWLKSKADAIAFQEAANFTMQLFNNCFLSHDRKPFALNQRTGTDRKEPLKTILNDFFPGKQPSE